VFSHLGVLSTELVREVGGFRLGMEGSQDWDLVLRCMERIGPEQVHHVPRVLYHWRIHSESTARSMNAKPYAAVAGERALNEHFERTGVRAMAEYVGFGYRVHYALPDVQPLVSLVIPTRNGLALTRQCIDSIVRKTTYKNYEILIVDNGSDDPAVLAYFKELATRPNFRVLRDDSPFNYSALNNMAVAQARGEVVALVNNDIEVMSPDWLSEMVSLALQPGVGAVGARLWYPDLTLQHGGVLLGLGGGVAGHANKGLPKGLNGYAGRAALIQSFSAVTAACLVVRKAVYEEVGGLDEERLKVAFNDIDFCLRLREAGYRNVWTPYADLLHHESATRGEDIAPEKRERFLREENYMKSRWAELLRHDPAYNPNLTADAEDFSYAWPPRVEAP
jgi:GT2 family glycosyltransferase